MFTIPTKEIYSSRMSRKSGKTKKAQAELVEDWQYVIDYHTDYHIDCEENRCDDYCRCGVIEAIQVNSTVGGIETFFSSCYTNYGTDLDRVLDFWFTRANFSSLSWDFEASSGYYGEELDRIFMEYDGNFFKKAATFATLSTKDKIEYLLKNEYGAVLAEVATITDWQLKTVKVEDVTTSLNLKMNAATLIEYKEFCDSKKAAHQMGNRRNGKTRTSKAFLNDLQILAPLCLSDDGKHYRLMDGRHRFETITKNTFELISWDKTGKIVARNKIIPNEIWVICPKE